MSTKRDRLKKMRDEHKTLMNEETPAEEYIEAAASYHKETAAAAKRERVVEAAPELPQEPLASAQQEPAPSAQQRPAASEMRSVAPETRRISEQPVSAPAPMPYSPVEASPKQEEVRPARNVPYTVANEPGKRISVSLRTENKNWMHRTALRCGLSIQDYMNILIEEAWQREQSAPYLWNEDEPIPERIPSSKTILVAIKLTNVNIERSQRMRAARCMNMTYYMNYLIEEEIKREQLQGMRRAIFD